MEEKSDWIPPIVKPASNNTNARLYSFVVFILTIPLSALFSSSFPFYLGLPGLALGITAARTLSQYFVWIQLGTVLFTVFVFYEVGRRIDFAAHHLRLAALSLAGTIAGNLPGFYLSTTSPNSSGWEIGLGYVSSFGLQEPSSILDLLTAAVAGFMIPIAGLALAYFVKQYRGPSLGGETNGETQVRERRFGFSRTFFIIGLVIVASAFPIAGFLQNLLATTFPPPPFFPILGPSAWNTLISGYVAFLVYPMLFLLAFFTLGKRRLNANENDLLTFAVSLFSAGAIGFFVGVFLSIFVASPSALARFFLLPNLARSILDSIANGLLVLVLGFAAAALGFVRRLNPIRNFGLGQLSSRLDFEVQNSTSQWRVRPFRAGMSELSRQDHF